MGTAVMNSYLKMERVRAVLGKPAFESQGVMLYHVESLSAMKSLPSDLFGLTITSPPYNLGKEYESTLSLDDYLQWTIDWITAVSRLCESTGSFWLNLGYIGVPERAKAMPIPYLLWKDIPFYLIQEVVWKYGAGVHTTRMFSPRNEKFLWYVKTPDSYTFNLDAVRDPDVKYPNQRKNGKIRVNPLGKNPSDVWDIPKVTTGEGMTGMRASPERTAHPAQFPLAVIDRIVKACSNQEDLVFDPFMGSGTTAEASLANGRCVVGFERNGDYIQIAADRIERFLRKEQARANQGLLI